MTINRVKSQRHRRHGFSLPEAVLAMVILSMAAAGVLLPFVSGASVQAEGLHKTLAAGLANDLLERVVRTPFDQIVAAPPVGWHGYTEEQGQVKDASGITFTDPIYANFSRDVSCREMYVAPQRGAPITPVNFIEVSVRVWYRGQQIATIDRLISK
jgi:prepilin-type N-terminal cleavage/methylation domain-containing protein